jgi:hypothetical protein
LPQRGHFILTEPLSVCLQIHIEIVGASPSSTIVYPVVLARDLDGSDGKT